MLYRVLWYESTIISVPILLLLGTLVTSDFHYTSKVVVNSLASLHVCSVQGFL